MQSIRSEFLGWNQPALCETATRLALRYPRLDLGNVIIAVPGQRAGRRLNEILAFLAEDQGLPFTPPQVVTESKLPELLYVPMRPFASELVQELAWAKALHNLPAARRRCIVPRPPPEGESLRWLELGKIFRSLHRELAADGLNFQSVLETASRITGFPEKERWSALAELQSCYLALLDQEQLWDIQEARLKAIELDEIQTDRDIILLGTVDLTRTLRKMLERVAGRVTAYVVAPEDCACRFDALGCLLASAWTDATIPLGDEQLEQVDGPEEQAAAVSSWLAELGSRYRNDEVVIGAPDESLVPQLQRQLEQCGVRGRWAEGVRLAETPPYRLLSAALRFAGRRRYEDLAALVRHPDFEEWLEQGRARGSLVAQLDDFYNQRLPTYLSAKDAEADSEDWPDLPGALRKIESWLGIAEQNRPPRAWGEIFQQLLADVYSGRLVDLDNEDDAMLHGALGRILKTCDQMRAIPQALGGMPLSAVDAFQSGLGPLGKECLPPPTDPDAVEILGWLELALDDSKALAVTSFNEGFVPQSGDADAFLPDCLRQELGLQHNERRYARDAYVTTVLCQSRPELRLVFARRDTNQDPRQPSRLIFACSDETMIERAQRYFAEQTHPSGPRRMLLLPREQIRPKSLFAVPEAAKRGGRIEAIPVTHFKAFLACSYRYYLGHVCDLTAITDSARELDGGAFGTLLHDTLAGLGRDPAAPRQSTREEEIFEFLAERLNMLAMRRYGHRRRRPSILLQLEQARQRLKAFARVQAKLVQDEWLIRHAEAEQGTDRQLRVRFPVDGEPIWLVGRIDRIDIHERDRKLRILDYKTADLAQKPDRAHRCNDKWIDLQLPLYRQLGRATNLREYETFEIELGYFNLPKRAEMANFELADWDEVALRSAEEEARKVIRQLREEEYGTPARVPPGFFDAFAAICLENQYPPSILDEAEEDTA
jgi:hypothetical protein